MMSLEGEHGYFSVAESKIHNKHDLRPEHNIEACVVQIFNYVL